MLKLAIIFFVIALITGLLGFTGISSAAAGISKLFFFIFLALFVIALIAAGLVAGQLI